MGEANESIPRQPEEKKTEYELSMLTTLICKADAELISRINFLLTKYYGIEEEHCKEAVDKALKPYLNQLRDDLWALIEYPYVDAMYRDTYYNFFARKLRAHHRDSIRVSFFKTKIDEDDFVCAEGEKKEYLEENYLGFLSIRPTFPQIIGRNILSHEALADRNLQTCTAKFNITVNSLKVKFRGYPHASQDFQSIKCAETSLWAILEYFGNKFPDYKPVLPSQINDILSRFSYKRLIPSDGLSGEQLAFSLRAFGFGPIIYVPERDSSDNIISTEEFNAIISIYIESGLPVLGLIEGPNTGHSINIIGREIDDIDVILGTPFKELDNGAQIIDYNMVERKYVIMDDNLPPFTKIYLKDPCEPYEYEKGKKPVQWSDCELSSIIAPLPHKAYLDAAEARFIFNNILSSKKYGLDPQYKYVIKVFIAASRTYKDCIAKSDMETNLKLQFMHMPMSKFVYVAEICTVDTFKESKCTGVLLLDATEVSTRENANMPLSFLAGYNNGQFFRQEFGNFSEVAIFAAPFETFKENLK